METRDEVILKLGRDRVLAHQLLFRHRHPNETPPFHCEMIRDWHGIEPRMLWLAFRGSAKSTIAEEALVIRGAYREFQNAIIVGNILDRAAERLEAIKHEIISNEYLGELFGVLRGPTWGSDEIILSNGVRILALGRGQALRGVKHLDWRPDLLFIDDLEDEEAIRTPEARLKTRRWLARELMPALDPRARARMAATPLDPESLAVTLSQSNSGWQTRVYPIEYKDYEGRRAATWEGRFPLPEIDRMRTNYVAQGLLRDYNMEYMCKAETPEEKPFRREQFKVAGRADVPPIVRTWQAAQVMFDPARTVRATSAATGMAAWSWMGNRLIVWKAWSKLLMPDEIVGALFAVNDELHPVTIGIEEDGLNEWLMQPIRHEQAKRGEMLPVRAEKAPKERSKLDFIRGLQPFFNAREVIFACHLPDLETELLGFPTGRIDCLNALAYALKMRPGAPFYEDFTARHVAEDLGSAAGTPYWLALNATGAIVTGVLVQLVGASFRVLADFVRDGDAGQVAGDIIAAAQLEAGGPVRPICAPSHFDRYHNFGLVQAVRNIPMEMRRGAGPEQGRAELRAALKRDARGAPSFQVSSAARWTLNALAGGYARAALKGGQVADYAEEGVYRTLMEGFESFAALLKLHSTEDEEGVRSYAHTPGGKRYLTALPGKR